MKLIRAIKKVLSRPIGASKLSGSLFKLRKASISMYSIRFRFSGNSTPQLDELSFQHPLFQPTPRISQRGRVSLGSKEGGASFNWTSGLRAFSLLLIAAAAQRATKSSAGVSLQGEAGSLAAALDSAIAKNAQWIADCFGVDRDGALLVRRFISRSNPERKRPGPVTVGIAPRVLNEMNIVVELDGTELSSRDDLEHLALMLDHSVGTLGIQESDGPSIRQPPVNQDQAVFLEIEESILQDTLKCLKAINVFDPVSLRERYQDIAKLRPFRRFAQKVHKLTAPVDRELRSCEALGLYGSERSDKIRLAQKHAPIRVLLPGSTFSSVVVLEHLCSCGEIPIELNYQFSHANEVLRPVLAGEDPDGVDACVVSLGQLARFLAAPNRNQFEPLMLMPPVSMHVLTPNREKSGRHALEKARQVHLLSEGGSSSSIFLDQVSERIGVSKRLDVQHCEPISFASLLKKDPTNRVVAWSPYALLVARLTGARTESFGQESMKENFLLVHKRILRDSNFALILDTSIRDSWLTLVEQPQLCREIVVKLLRDPKFSKSLRRWVGWDMLASG